MSQTQTTVSYNGIELTSITGLTILATNPYVPAKRKLSRNLLARTNKSKTNSAFYTERELQIKINISRETRDLLEQSIDSLMTILQGLEKDLLVRQAGTTRKYVATYTDAVISNSGGSYITMDLVFVTSDHFGYDNVTTTNLTVGTYTGGNRQDALTFGGSAPLQQPTITVTFSYVYDATAKDVVIGNANLGMAITINRVWTTLDVLVIDASAQSVKVNGVEVAFTGAIPEFAVGEGVLTYNDTFTARTVSYVVTYVKRYI
jgi:hypothetical protein